MKCLRALLFLQKKNYTSVVIIFKFVEFYPSIDRSKIYPLILGTLKEYENIMTASSFHYINNIRDRLTFLIVWFINWSCLSNTVSFSLFRQPIRKQIKRQQYITRNYEIPYLAHWFFNSKKNKKTEEYHLKVSTYFYMSFLCLKVILTMKHYIKWFTIFIWIFAIFWCWKLALWNLGQLAPAWIFLLATGSRPPCLRYLCCWLTHVFGKRTPYKII